MLLEHPVWKKPTFHIPSYPTIYIPLYPRFWESCKVEFYQPSCCTRAKHARKLHTCEACQKLNSHSSCYATGQKSQAGQAVCSRLELATKPSHEVKLLEHLVWEKLTFHIPSHPTIYIPLYPRLWESCKVEFYQPSCCTRAKHAKKLHTYQACQKLNSNSSCCTTRQKFQAGQAVCSRLELATQLSREVKLPEHPIWEKLTFHIPSHPTIYIPLYPRFWESCKVEFYQPSYWLYFVPNLLVF